MMALAAGCVAEAGWEAPAGDKVDRETPETEASEELRDLFFPVGEENLVVACTGPEGELTVVLTGNWEWRDYDGAWVLAPEVRVIGRAEVHPQSSPTEAEHGSPTPEGPWAFDTSFFAVSIRGGTFSPHPQELRRLIPYPLRGARYDSHAASLLLDDAETFTVTGHCEGLTAWEEKALECLVDRSPWSGDLSTNECLKLLPTIVQQQLLEILGSEGRR